MFGGKWKNNKKNKRVKSFLSKNPLGRDGFSIVEVMVAIVIVVTVFLSILSFFSLDIKSSERNRMRLTAISLCEETMEAVRNFRDNSEWADDGLGKLITDTNYYPSIGSTGWSMVLGIENINGYLRSVVFQKVSRNTDDNIETNYNSANDDPNTRKIVVTISWNDKQGETSEIISTYLTNWKQ